MTDHYLSSILDYPTGVLAPVSVEDAEGNISFKADPQSTVSLRVSSEFTNYIAPVVPFGGKSKLGLCQDIDGQPIMYSIGNDDRFYCLKYIKGGSEAWTSYDITPDNSKKVITFDVQQAMGNIILAVSLEGTTGSHVYSSVCATGSFDPLNISWAYRSGSNIDQSRRVISLFCGGQSSHSKPFVVAGTEASDSRVATFYTIDTDPVNGSPWTTSVIPNNATRVFGVAPALHEILGVGTYTLYEVEGGPTLCAFNKKNAAISRDLETKGLGEIRSIFSVVTPWPQGFTDLFLATEKGVAYFPHFQDIQDPPIVIMGDISFKQVVASEYGKKIIAFMISDAGELYYIEGTRGSTISFTASGYPLRTGIKCLSAQYNTAANSTELMYIDSSSKTQIRHLWRDPISFSWLDSVIAVRSSRESKVKTMSYPAYVTMVTVKNKATGASVGSDYPCMISSNWVQVIINDRAYTLTSNPIEIKTDTLGRINIVQLADTSLSSASYKLSLTLFGASTIEIQPTQRIIAQLSTYNTVESLQNARTTDGRPITFKDTSKFKETAELLGQVNPLVHQLNSNASTKIVSDTMQVVTGGSEQKGFFDSPLEFIGDLWETIKQGLKKAFSVTVKVIGTVVRVVIKLALKTISFVVSTVNSLLRAVSGFLRDSLGITALDDLLNWLGFIPDWKTIKETHQQLVTFANLTLTSTVDSFTLLRPFVVGYLDSVKDKLAEYIEDRRDEPKKPQNASNPLGFLSWLFDNPVVNFLIKYSPIKWLMSQIGEIVADEIKLPDLSPIIDILRQSVGNLLEEQMETFSRLGDDIVKKLKSFVSGSSGLFSTLGAILGDAIWTCYDVVRIIVLVIFDAIGPIIAAFKDILNFEMKFPIISDLWDEFTDGIPLTLMNLFTFLPSVCLSLFSALKYKRAPFEEGAFGNPKKYVLTKSFMEKSITNVNTYKPNHEKPIFPVTGSLVAHPINSAGSPFVLTEKSQAMYFMQGGVKEAQKTADVSSSSASEKEQIRTCEVGQVWSGLVCCFCNYYRSCLEVVLFREAGLGKDKTFEDLENDHNPAFKFIHRATLSLNIFAAIASAVETGFTCFNPHLQHASLMGTSLGAYKVLGTLLQFLGILMHAKGATKPGNMFSLASAVLRSLFAGIAEISAVGLHPESSAKFACDMFETGGAVAGMLATFPGVAPPFNYKAILVSCGFDFAALASAITWTSLVMLD